MYDNKVHVKVKEKIFLCRHFSEKDVNSYKYSVMLKNY